MIAQLFLRELPATLRTGVESGSLKVFGGVVRSVTDGRIVAHLQETGGLSQLLSLATSGPAAPLKLVGEIIQIVQTEQIKAGISRLEDAVALVNQLQVGSLALGAVGIGVSAAGFAVMNRKIDGLRADVQSLGEGLELLRADLAMDRAEYLADMLEQLRGVARDIDHRWSMGEAKAVDGWHRDADEAGRLNAFFGGRAARMLAAHPAAAEEAGPLLDAAAMASGLRVAALALAGETRTAIGVARDDAARGERLTGGIGAIDLLRAAMASAQWTPGRADAGEALTTLETDARAAATRLRAREAVATTRAEPLLALEAKGVHPREWMGAARAEQDVPLLLMEA